MGGSANVLKQAQTCFERGEYRRVAQVMKHVVFAEPNNEQAKQLLADAKELFGLFEMFQQSFPIVTP